LSQSTAKPVQGPKEQQKRKHTDSLCKICFVEKQTHTSQNIWVLMSVLSKYQVIFGLLSHPYRRIHLSSSEMAFVLGTEG